MNQWWVIIISCCSVWIIGGAILVYSLGKAAKEADDMMHEAFLEEVRQKKEEMGEK